MENQFVGVLGKGGGMDKPTKGVHRCTLNHCGVEGDSAAASCYSNSEGVLSLSDS